jgi:hypothetical protein
VGFGGDFGASIRNLPYSMDSSLPPSSPLQSSSPVRPSLLDPYAALSGSRATEPWRPPRFAKRDRSPEPPDSSPATYKRVKKEEPPSSPFGTRDLPATSSPFGTPPTYIPAVPRSPIRSLSTKSRKEYGRIASQLSWTIFAKIALT